MSLTELVEARRGRELLDYIDGLPSASRTREAILNDPEAVEQLAMLPDPEGDWSPRVSEWTLLHALMYDQRAVLARIEQLLEAKVTGKRVKQREPLPGPRTLLDDTKAAIRNAEREARMQNLAYEFGYRRPPETD